MSAQRSPKGFAVVDFETTGINPSGGDRAIEVGIVHVAPDGTLEDEAETLIRVQRDLGASNLHHIHAADLFSWAKEQRRISPASPPSCAIGSTGTCSWRITPSSIPGS